MQSITPGAAEIRAALARHQLIDITTTGRRSGRRYRIELDGHWIDGQFVISGLPGPRDWYANLRANPQFVVHLKQGLRADLPAMARPITDPVERRTLLDGVTANWNRQHQIDRFVERSPLVVITFPDLPGA